MSTSSSMAGSGTARYQVAMAAVLAHCRATIEYAPGSNATEAATWR